MKSRRSGAHSIANLKSHGEEHPQGAEQEECLENPEPIASDPIDPVEETSSASDKSAQVSFFITKAQKLRLHEHGYSDEQIAQMKPAEAHKILGLQ
jgi:hypothetical protein